MCATCVAQGVTYIGGAVGALRVMGARARARRLAGQPDEAAPTDTPASDDDRADAGLKVGQPG